MKKISYIIPEDSYTFFKQIIGPLEEFGIEVEVNKISNSDVVLGAIMPATWEMQDYVFNSGKPFILWHWDYYSFVDLQQPRWSNFLKHLSKAVDVWSCTYEVARQLKEKEEIDSYVIPSWVCSQELKKLSTMTKDYAFYASSCTSIGKRVDWAIQACKLARIPLKLLKSQGLPRSQYLELLANCRVYVMTAFEESNASIPAQEAAALGKPVVLADIPASREVFGDTAYFFNNWDFGSLVEQIKLAANYGPDKDCRNRILKNYDVSKVVPRLVERLEYVFAKLP